MNQSVNYKAVCRTAPATPGLLIFLSDTLKKKKKHFGTPFYFSFSTPNLTILNAEMMDTALQKVFANFSNYKSDDILPKGLMQCCTVIVIRIQIFFITSIVSGRVNEARISFE